MGFLDIAEKSSAKRRRREPRPETLQKAGCSLCPLNALEDDLNHPKLEPYSKKGGSGRFYILGGKPDIVADESGTYFSDAASSSMLLDNIPSEFKNDVRFNYSVRCRPYQSSNGDGMGGGAERNPSNIEIECCRGFAEKDILETDPERILLVGNIAVKWAIGFARVSKWAGQWLPLRIGDRVYSAMPLWHPDTAYGAGDKTGYEAVWDAALDRFFYGECPKFELETLEDIDRTIVIEPGKKEIKKFFEENNVIGLDIETYSDEDKSRALRPYGSDCGIVCVAFAGKKQTLVVFEDMLDFAIGQMADAGCGVFCHNLEFDLEWLFHRWEFLKTTNNRWHCTMAMAYVLDEKPGGNTLDEMSAIVLGLRDLKKSGSVDVTRLRDFDKNDVGYYCGRDARACYLLARDLTKRLMSEQLMHVYTDQRRRIPTAIISQMRGVHIDFEKADGLREQLEKKIKEIDAKIVKHPDVKKFRAYKPTDAWLADFLSRGLGLGKSIQSEDRVRGVSVSKSVLADVDHPVVDLVVQRREVVKANSTYVREVCRDGKSVWPDGKIHTHYNTHSLATRRTSSENPNIQNVPKHDKNPWAGSIRGLYSAPKGHRMISMDYGQVEARVFAMASEDERLCEVVTERYDIHTDWTKKILDIYPEFSPYGMEALEDKKLFGEVRFKTKGFIFGNFYGQSLRGCWEYLGCDEDTARELYSAFWDEFGGVKSWHRKLLSDYDYYGYVETLTGFRRRAPMRYHEIINTPIQSASYDIIQDCWNRVVEKALEEDKPWLVPPIQIHDDLVFYVPEKKFDDAVDDIVATAFDWDDQEFSWINVPLSVEVESGKDWSSMEPVGEFFSDD